MRHNIAGYKLGRDTEHRRALLRNLAIALFTHGQITTTVHKAKAVRPFVEKLITAARKGDLASRRRVIKAIGDPILVPFDLTTMDRKALRTEGYKVNAYGELQDGPRLVKKLFEEIAPQYADRPGGYTRIVRLSQHRIGDGSQLCVLQLVGKEEGPQVRGQYSRRRQKALRRTEFAAKLRKGRSAAGGEPAGSDAAASTATVEAPAAAATELPTVAETPPAEPPAEST